MSTAERLKDCRKYLELTQAEFAEKLLLKWNKIKAIETNTHKLTPEIANKIEQVYFISGWWLLTGKGNMVEEIKQDTDLNKKIKIYFDSSKKRNQQNILHHIMEDTFIENYFSELDNRNQIFFMGLNEQHIYQLEETVKSYLNELERKYIIVNCKNKTKNQILKDILVELNINLKSNTEHDLFIQVQEILYFKDVVFVFKELSKAKSTKMELFFRGLIKTLDDAHFKNINPMSNIIFLDYASFLEKHQDFISIYLRTNLVTYSDVV